MGPRPGRKNLMCDTATRQAVEDIVIEKINTQEMFTAWDITMEARRRQTQVQHHETREVVHDFFENGSMGSDYTRTLINVGAPVKPFLYHLRTADIKHYNKSGSTKPKTNKKSGNVTVQNPPAASPVAAGPSISVGGMVTQPKAGEVARADARGTVCIPATVLKSAGFAYGDTAYVYAVPNMKSLIVVKDPADAGGSAIFRCRKYTVDYHGNVRVTRKCLEMAQIPAGSKGQQYGVLHQGKTVTLKTS